jgi:cytochrome c553
MTAASLRGVLAIVLAGACSALAAEDIVAGRAKAQACAVCHGPLGVSAAPDTPNLAGHPATYLVAQLQHFRSGARKHEVMNVMARMLSDADIANLAAWFSAIKVEATAPP